MNATRKQFVRQSGALTSVLAGHQLFSESNEQQDTLRVGVIGCGGRGTGAVTQALKADPKAKLVAMCDFFEHRLQASYERLKSHAQVDVKPAHRFTGLEGYQKCIDLVDVVLLASPPGFRPLHLAACAEAGKHVFCEKPVAVDMLGLKSVLESAKILKQKNKSLVSGLCWRYDYGIQETVKRVKEGAIGDIKLIEATTMSGGMWLREEEPTWNSLEKQINNWNKWQWLCGDIYCESHIHSIDLASWVMNDTCPKDAWGMGGRQIPQKPEWGNIFDHHHVRFNYDNGIVMTSYSRNQKGSKPHYDVHVVGTKGEAWLISKRMKTNKNWRYRGPRPNMYQVEHDVLFKSIRKGEPVDNSEYMCNSNKVCLMGRTSSYTGKLITEEMIDGSKLDLSLDRGKSLKHQVQALPLPGLTPFI